MMSEGHSRLVSIEEIERAESAYDLPLGFDGCPCFSISLEGQVVEGHCWRVCRDCKFCGIHVEREVTPTVVRLRKLLSKMDWSGKWKIRVGLRGARARSEGLVLREVPQGIQGRAALVQAQVEDVRLQDAEAADARDDGDLG